MAIISVSIPRKILEKVDSSLDEQGFASRSEMIRQALRAFMTEGKTLRELAGEITATVTIIYKRKAKRGRIFDIQHSYGDLISTFLHAHINGDHCLEVIVVKGDSTILRKLVEALRSNEQIIQIKVAVLRQSNLYGPRL
jgi:CopG family nickel-responsive transcriptional regulator